MRYRSHKGYIGIGVGEGLGVAVGVGLGVGVGEFQLALASGVMITVPIAGVGSGVGSITNVIGTVGLGVLVAKPTGDSPVGVAVALLMGNED